MQAAIKIDRSPPGEWHAEEGVLDEALAAQIDGVLGEITPEGRRLVEEFQFDLAGDTFELTDDGLEFVESGEEPLIEPLRATSPPMVLRRNEDGNPEMVTFEDALQEAYDRYWGTDPRYTHKLMLSEDAMSYLTKGIRPDASIFSDGTGEQFYGSESPNGQLGDAIWNGAKNGASVEERQQARDELDQFIKEGTALLDVILLESTYTISQARGQDDPEIRRSLQRFLTGVTSLVAGSVASAELRDSLVARVQSKVANSNRITKFVTTKTAAVATGVVTAGVTARLTGLTEHVPVEEGMDKLVELLPSIEAVAPYLGAAAAGAVAAVPTWIVAKNRLTGNNIAAGIDKWVVDPKKTDYAEKIEAVISNVEAEQDAPLGDDAKELLRQEMRLSVNIQDWLKEYGNLNNAAEQIIYPAGAAKSISISIGSTLKGLYRRYVRDVARNWDSDTVINEEELQAMADRGGDKFRELILELIGLVEANDDTNGLDDKAIEQAKGLGAAMRKGAQGKVPVLKHAK